METLVRISSEILLSLTRVARALVVRSCVWLPLRTPSANVLGRLVIVYFRVDLGRSSTMSESAFVLKL